MAFPVVPTVDHDTDGGGAVVELVVLREAGTAGAAGVADGTPPARSAYALHPGFVRTMAAHGLGRQAVVAADAVQVVGLRASPLRTPYQWLADRSGWRQRAGAALKNPAGAQIDGNSATLAIALGLAMAGARSSRRYRRVIATGDLAALPDRDGTAPGDGVRVEPVGQLARKLAAVEAWAGQARLRRTVFLVPLQNDDQEPTDPETFQRVFARQRRALKRVGVTLMPVDRLREAMATVGATRLRAVLADHVIRFCVMLCLGLGLGSVGVFAWSHRAIDLRFAGTAAVDGTARPALLRVPANETRLRRPMCRLVDGTAAVVAGEWLEVHVGTGAELLARYHLAVVMLSKTEGEPVAIGVRPADGAGRDGSIAPGDYWRDAVKTMPARFETNAVAVVAARWPIDALAVQQGLRLRAETGAGVTELLDHLRQTMPGMVSHTFRTVPTQDCPQ